MHVWTHLKKESEGKTGLGIQADGMVEHDGHVGQLLKLLDDLGLTENTIVMYSTDNGAEVMSWPDGGTTPFRGEKATNWEGGWRVPAAIRWPGTIKPGTVLNGIGSHEDLLPTLLAAAGDPNVKEDVLKGTKKIGNTTYKAHIDGYNLIPWLSGQTEESPRQEFLYWGDDGTLLNLRYGNWKLVFQEQRAHGFNVWEEPFVQLRAPKIINLRMDPFERADHEGIDYERWRFERTFLLVPAQAYIGQWLASFKEFPPRMRPGSFSLDQVMEKLTQETGSGK
jgi:arylsulfatase